MRLRHRVTGVTVSVADDKKMAPEWKPVGATAPAGLAPAVEPLVDYQAWTVDDLKAEIARRNAGRGDGDRLSSNQNKAGLVDTLTADDT